jgi:hypothetical protein
MFKVSIKNQDNQETNAGVFPTEEAAQEWYDYNLDFFPNPHTKVVTSLIEIKKEADRDQESHEAIELGTKLIKTIRKINRRKLKTGVWDGAKFNSLLTNPIAASIERALWNGSLTTASYLILQMSEFYSDLEISIFVDAINEHENKWIGLI